MALPIEQLYKARDFLSVKNISGTRVELVFKNPVVAMMAKGKIAEIANECGPDCAFTSCALEGKDLTLTYNPELVSERLLGEVFNATPERAQHAAKELAEFVLSKSTKNA